MARRLLAVLAVQDLARQHHGRVGAPHKASSESRERTFETDIADPARMRAELARMAEELCAGLSARGRRGRTAEDLHDILARSYAKEPFVHVLPFGQTPQTRHVRCSSIKLPGRVKITSTQPRRGARSGSAISAPVAMPMIGVVMV